VSETTTRTALSGERSPDFRTILRVVKALRLRLTVEVRS
jgi:DNA-binding phage protein